MAKQKTFLHIGCGGQGKQHTPFNTPEWKEIRFDIDPNAKPDIIGTVLDMSAVQDSSVDAVYSSHNIEHIYLHQVPDHLNEVKRVLKPDGFFFVRTPDMQAAAHFFAEGEPFTDVYMSSAGPVNAHDMFYGYTPYVANNEFMAHKCGFTASTLRQILTLTGFESVLVGRSKSVIELKGVASKKKFKNPDDFNKFCEPYVRFQI